MRDGILISRWVFVFKLHSCKLNIQMQSNLFNIIDNSGEKFPKVNTELCFDAFIRYLEERVKNETTGKKKYFEKTLETFQNSLKVHGPVSLVNIPDFNKELTLIYNCMIPPFADETKTFWALGLPICQSIFYGTDAFYKLLQQSKCNLNINIALPLRQNSNAESNKIWILYMLIFEKLYGLSPVHEYELIHSFTDPESGLPKYHQIRIDNRFLDVSVIGELPEFDFQEISRNSNLALLNKILPLDKFIFKGFTILESVDITTSQVLDNIKNIIIKAREVPSYYQDVILSLKTIVGNKHIDFALLPFLKLNGKTVFDLSADNHSIILDLLAQKKIEETNLENLIHHYIEHPQILLFNTGKTGNSPNLNFFSDGLKDLNIVSYALLPVYHKTEIVGALEIFTGEEEVLNEKILTKLNITTPLLAQLLKDAAVDFESDINDIIKERFTSLQPAVQWKFNEKAWEYKKTLHPDKPKPVIENIKFENVFPLYGAIDIRNSTIERNKALRNDIEVQLKIIADILVKLKDLLNITIVDEMLFSCEEWLKSINNDSIENFELNISDFLNRDIIETFKYFKSNNKKAAQIINSYDEAMDPLNGIVFANRRALESSIQIINTGISNYLDLFNDELQQSYPCYFEKLRSDGIEYDIYIGQSIAPKRPFNMLYLRNIRLWQLASMAALAKLTHNLIPQMETPLKTTQLIYVNSNSIDISFRTDERRFDVEGAYNIRYEIIKKRIDKITLKNSNERLTQPGKIAIVYFSAKEEKEYMGYILYLQRKGILLDDVEKLELEELQGVNGLLAIRIGVKL